MNYENLLINLTEDVKKELQDIKKINDVVQGETKWDYLNFPFITIFEEMNHASGASYTHEIDIWVHFEEQHPPNIKEFKELAAEALNRAEKIVMNHPATADCRLDYFELQKSDKLSMFIATATLTIERKHI